MAYFVLMYRETRPDRLDVVLGRIRHRLGSSPTAQRGRRASRVFQRLDEPTHLLTVSEWTDERSFDEFAQSAVFAETDRLGGAPASIVPLVPLIRFEHMARRATVASCVTITASPETTPALRTLLVGTAHQEMKAASGIVSREVYQARDTPSTFLVVHTWASLADVERFRASLAINLDQLQARLQTTIVAFTGALAAEFSALDPPP